jgi:hypothetical protein
MTLNPSEGQSPSGAKKIVSLKATRAKAIRPDFHWIIFRSREDESFKLFLPVAEVDEKGGFMLFHSRVPELTFPVRVDQFDMVTYQTIYPET